MLDLAGAAPVRAVLLGGAAGTFVGPNDLDVALTFEGTRAIGATVGSGVVMAFGERVDLLDIVWRIAQFFRDESCGQSAAGTWDPTRQHVTDTICPYCGVGCTLSLHVQGNRIVKVTSPADVSVTHGHLCIKGRFGVTFVESSSDDPGR